jgi:hypothetical protein
MSVRKPASSLHFSEAAQPENLVSRRMLLVTHEAGQLRDVKWSTREASVAMSQRLVYANICIRFGGHFLGGKHEKETPDPRCDPWLLCAGYSQTGGRDS